MKFQDLIGKTIMNATLLGSPHTDDCGHLKLDFDDGTSCMIIGGYDEYSGISNAEYPISIEIYEDTSYWTRMVPQDETEHD